jgi:hypothetical protein
MTDKLSTTPARSPWTKLPGIEGGHGGCLNCGFQHAVLPMEAVIAVGFGSASLTKGDECIYDEQDVERPGSGYTEYMTAEQAEALAAADPDHDWRIHLYAPLSERHYQRQGDKHWVLYEKGEGFA